MNQMFPVLSAKSISQLGNQIAILISEINQNYDHVTFYTCQSCARLVQDLRV